jgi:hypothetical protein
VVVEQHAVVGMPGHGARQHGAFDIAADRGELLRVAGMVDSRNVLLDDPHPVTSEWIAATTFEIGVGERRVRAAAQLAAWYDSKGERIRA